MIKLDEALYDEVAEFLLNLPGFMGVCKNDELNQVYRVMHPDTGELALLVVYDHSIETSAVERICFVSKWAWAQYKTATG